MRERVERLVGGVSRLMWVMTFHSACARILRREAPRLGYKGTFTIYDEADSLRMVKRCMDELDVDPKRFPPRAIQSQISAAKNRLVDAGRVRRAAGVLLRADGRRRLHAVREADARGQRDGLRRPAGPDGQPAGAVRRRPRALPARLPPRPRRRVPGHQPRPVPAAAAALGAAPQPVRRRRRRPVDLRLPQRRHPQHPRLRARLPRRRGGEAGAELPLHADDPLGRQRDHRPTTAARSRSGFGPTSATASR